MRTFVRLLGRASVRVGERVWEPKPDRRSALLVYLAHASSWVPRDDLLYLLWPDGEERRGRASLRQLLSTVRRLPYAEGLEVERRRVRWWVETDLHLWLESFAEGRGAEGGVELPGELLAGFRLPSSPEFESWLELERAAWDDRCRAWVLTHARRDAAEGRIEAATVRLDAWLARAPLDEEALRVWLAACLRRGARTAALARFAEFEARLANEMALTPERETLALVAALRSEAVAIAPHPVGAGAVARSGLLRVADRWGPGRRFVGRELELARLDTELLVDGAPVVTVVGVGGMGKSRLAWEAATRLQPRFPDGVAVAWLPGGHALSQVGPALLDAIGSAVEPRRPPLDQVATALADRRMLLVVDNLQPLPGVPELVARVRAAAPGVAWLLTAREQLGLACATTIELRGLRYPLRDSGEPLAGFDAVQLLVDRARRAGCDLDLVRDAAAIARVCRLTGGMPLALELAAGWLRVLSIDAIADELASGIDLVAASESDVEPRHVSLRMVFDASWRALPPTERAALTRLAVFHAGFSEPAAREVADVGRPQLLALRNKAFVVIGVGGRFALPPLLEAYLRHRAAEDAVAWRRAEERHARWFLALLATWEAAGREGRERAANLALTPEHANLEAAWAHAVAAGWWEALTRADTVWWTSYVVAGHPERPSAMLRAALAQVPRGSVAWCLLESQDAGLAKLAGRLLEAYERRRQVVETLRGHGDRGALVRGLTHFAEAAEAVGRLDEARAALADAFGIAEALGDRHRVDQVVTALQSVTDDPEAREGWYRVGAAERRRTGNVVHEIVSLADQASFTAHTYGEYGGALALVDRAVALERRQDWSPMRLATWLQLAAEIRIAAGDLEAAEAQLAEALRLWQPLRPVLPRGDADARALMATAAWLRGDADAAVAAVTPGSEAGRTLVGELLRSEMARVRGRTVSALGCADQALALVPLPRAGRRGHRERVLALLAAADCAFALGEAAAARSQLQDAVAIAVGWRFLPALLHAGAVAAALLPADLAAAVRGWVAAHPATPFAVRRRVAAAEPLQTAPADRAASWASAQALAGWMATALASPLRPASG